MPEKQSLADWYDDKYGKMHNPSLRNDVLGR